MMPAMFSPCKPGMVPPYHPCKPDIFAATYEPAE